MNFFSRLRYAFSGNNRIDFFAYAGGKDSPAFEIDLRSMGGISEVYEKCSTVSSVVGRLAAAMANGKWWIIDGKDNDVSKENRKSTAIFERPNLLQSWTEFLIQADVYRLLYGEVFILAIKPEGFHSAEETTALWVINPEYIEIKSTGKLHYQTSISDIVTSYVFQVGNEQTVFTPEQLLHIKDVHQNLDFSPFDLRGAPRLRTLEYEVRNIIQAQEAVYSLNKDRGAQGILSNESKDEFGGMPITPSEKEELQHQFSKYGLGEHQRKIIITNAHLKWQQMSYNVRDLMLFDGMKQNIENICDAFDYPFELLSNAKGTTFENKGKAMKFLYQDVVIPFSKIYAEKFTQFLGLKNSKIDIDFSEVAVLQEDEKEKASVLLVRNQANQIAYQNGIITQEEWRLNIGMDEVIYGKTFYQIGGQNE